MRAALFAVALLAIGAAALAGAAVAQNGPTDGRGDDLNCPDFEQFGGQAAAQANLESTLPDDPNRLDADEDGVACEDFYGLSAEEEAAIADGTATETPAAAPTRRPRRTPPAGSTPTPTPVPTPPARPPAGVEPGVDLPPQIARRVEGCRAIAVSRRSVAAAGCPDGGVVVIRLGPDDPDLEPFARAGDADTRRNRR